MKTHKDNRGIISMILENCLIGSISRIESLPNTFRARHFHSKDSHWIVVNEGQVIIYEKPNGINVRPTKIVLNKGDLHYTPPMTDHEMRFSCFTVFDCYSKQPRDQENYENDTTRLDYDMQEKYDNWPNG